MLTRQMRKRGATVMVEAHGELLFAPGTELATWKDRFSNRMTAAVVAFAPTHGDTGARGYRPHPGPHLKETITSKTSTRITAGGGSYYIATGSRSNYALYPDQGTGVYAGHSPFLVKVLPPMEFGQPSLYERNAPWIKPNKQIVVQGQRAKHYFDRGLTKAFQSMIHRSWVLPGEGVSGMKDALTAFPETLAAAVAANTMADAAFSARLTLWRSWREAAYGSKKRSELATSLNKIKKAGQKRGANNEQLAGHTARLQAWANGKGFKIRKVVVLKTWQHTFEVEVRPGVWQAKHGTWNP
jgi:hypothetical protein